MAVPACTTALVTSSLVSSTASDTRSSRPGSCQEFSVSRDEPASGGNRGWLRRKGRGSYEILVFVVHASLPVPPPAPAAKGAFAAD